MKPLLKDVLTPLRWEDDGVMKKQWRALGSGGLDSLTKVDDFHNRQTSRAVTLPLHP